MSIQSTINQGLSLMGLLVSQTPMAEASRTRAREEAELSESKRRLAKAEEVTGTVQEMVEEIEKLPTENERRIAEEEYSSALERETEAQMDIFQREPTREGIRSIIRSRSARMEFDEAAREAREALERERERQEISNAVTAPFNPTLDTIVKGGKFDGRKK